MSETSKRTLSNRRGARCDAHGWPAHPTPLRKCRGRIAHRDGSLSSPPLPAHTQALRLNVGPTSHNNTRAHTLTYTHTHLCVIRAILGYCCRRTRRWRDQSSASSSHRASSSSTSCWRYAQQAVSPPRPCAPSIGEGSPTFGRSRHLRRERGE